MEYVHEEMDRVVMGALLECRGTKYLPAGYDESAIEETCFKLGIKMDSDDLVEATVRLRTKLAQCTGGPV